jgi:hypothetical protein
MNKLIFLLWAFVGLSSAKTFAQFSNVWSMLEGRWYSIQQNDTLYTQWTYPNRRTLENRVFRLQGKDTIDISRSVASCRKKQCTLTHWGEAVAAGGQPEHFSLVSDGYDRLIWENTGAAPLLKHLEWVAVSMRCCQVLADKKETGFKRVKDRLVPLSRLLKGD